MITKEKVKALMQPIYKRLNDQEKELNRLRDRIDDLEPIEQRNPNKAPVRPKEEVT